MSDPDLRPRRRRDVDISRSPLLRWLRPRFAWLGVTILSAVVLVLVLQGEQEWPAPRLVLILPGGTALLFACWLVWIVVRRGTLTWMRLARAPARAVARGDAPEAERQFARALARAQRFGERDPRRGLMLFELAGYAKSQGRYPQARELYEECVDLLALRGRQAPLDYFAALNNYAIYYIHLRDHAAAQRILERVLDLTLVRRKIAEGNAVLTAGVRGIEFVLHLNLAVLFLQMHEVDEARAQLEEAEDAFEEMAAARRRRVADHYGAIRALVRFHEGRFADAARELEYVKNADDPAFLWVRARLAMVRLDGAAAEGLLRRYFEHKRKEGPLHRPDFRDHFVELAEALASQDRHDEAFAALAEARAIAADYALPPDAAWRRTLEGWLRRAREQGRPDAAALEAELRQLAAAPAYGIMVSDRLRVRR